MRDHTPSDARRQRRPVGPPVAPVFVDPAKFPDVYALTADGDCMGAELPNGAKLGFTTAERPRRGDIVVLWFRPGRVPAGPHQARVKRLVREPPSWVSFPHQDVPGSEVEPFLAVEMTHPPRRFEIRCADLLAMHKFIGVIPPERLAWPKVPAEAVALDGRP
ncbi:hypothetical protein CCR97_19030 [Rhodoplanes elegans]|uniref:Uncharacterized protein n=1 Tax=Rhodoplanes elegans TaxID=29408 RepID=A0A327KR28_9BRAD|nr:hypothetical protein [Rhodoplanes elegans]MBK5960279.1 hypothetical protein [Rhodoplanes elegans]RAI40727.1 hypothetical protein CH338_05415 [Rhodoplanes elegans]